MNVKGREAQAPAQTPAQTPAKVPTGILKMDPAMDELIDTNAQVEPVIKDFFYFTEGIVWVPQGKDSGYWLFAEMAANKILKLAVRHNLELPDSRVEVTALVCVKDGAHQPFTTTVS